MSDYQSLRLRNNVHKLRYGVQPLLVEANGSPEDGSRNWQTITYKEEPFPHFEVLPSGVQIPLHNVASAIPRTASIATKVAKTVGAMKAAREAKQAAAKKAADDAAE